MAKKTQAKTNGIKVNTLTDAQMKALLVKMQAEMKRREEQPKFKEVETGLMTLEFRNKKGEKIRAFKNLKKEESFKLRRDLYKLLVTSLKQEITMHEIKEVKQVPVKAG